MLCSRINTDGIHYTKDTDIDKLRLRQTFKFVCATNSLLNVVKNKYFRNMIKSYNSKSNPITRAALRTDIQDLATSIRNKHIKLMDNQTISTTLAH